MPTQHVCGRYENEDMTYLEWSEPARLMEAHIGPVTQAQQALAAAVGFAMPQDLPRGVAALMLEDHLLPRIWADSAHDPSPASEKQVAFLEVLSNDRALQHGILTKRVASAWIDHYLTRRNLLRLCELKIRSGDKVTKIETWANQVTGEMHSRDTEHVVSSIGGSGLVYFKGGNGQCAWPSTLRQVNED